MNSALHSGEIEAAAAALRANQVVAYPTETVYGLGVNPFSEEALDALFTVKARDPGRPVLLVVDSLDQLARRLPKISAAARRCMEAFWPGPLSLLLPADTKMPKRLLGDDGCICVRCPDHAVARQLCRAWGDAVTSTSANLSGQAPARNARDAALPGVAMVLDGGDSDDLAPSTIFNPDSGQMLRKGPITAEMLVAAGVSVSA